MKYLLWPGLFFSSISLLFFIPLFNPVDIPIGVVLIISSILITSLAFLKTPILVINKKYCLLFIIPLCIALLVIPFPASIGIIILSLGLLLHNINSLIQKHELLHRLATSCTLIGLILCLQTGLIFILTIFSAHTHRVDMFSPVVSFFLNLFETPSATNAGIVIIQSMQTTYPFTTTLEKLGFYPFCLFSLAAVILLLLFTEKRRILLSLLIYSIIGFFYLLLRYVTLILIYVNTKELSIFWNPFITMVSFIPFALLLIKAIPLIGSHLKRDTFQYKKITKKTTIVVLLAFLCSFFLIFSITYHDPGIKKQGRILIDEYHSDWEDSTQALNTTWYGQLSTYNYYSWQDLLSYYYTVEHNLDTPLTSERLRTTDILILKCPTQPYSSDEITLIHDYVRNGGGLFLIGDHTDVFGMNTFLNQIIEPLGLRFNSDATYEMQTNQLTTYTPNPRIKHPVVHHLDSFEFMTSCSLQPTSLLSSLLLQNVMIGTQIISEPGTYSTENFFRKTVSSPDSSYGVILQCAALTYGQGRILAFTDSTVLSSFCLFTDGYTPFSLSSIEYLNRTNQYTFIHPFFILLALIYFSLVLYLMRHDEKIKILFIFVLTGLLAVATIAPLMNMYTKESYPLPTNHTKIPIICFDQDHSNSSILLRPTTGFYTDPNNYGTFYVWTQRLGYIPQISTSIQNAVNIGDAVVFINPNTPFPPETIQLLSEYVTTGGNIVILDSIMNHHSTTNELTGSYGLWLTTEAQDHTLPSLVNNQSLNQTLGAIATPYLAINGGESMLVDTHNRTICSRVRLTNADINTTGQIIVFVDSYTFSDATMGGPFTQPTEQQQAVYATQFYLLETILFGS